MLKVLTICLTLNIVNFNLMGTALVNDLTISELNSDKIIFVEKVNSTIRHRMAIIKLNDETRAKTRTSNQQRVSLWFEMIEYCELYGDSEMVQNYLNRYQEEFNEVDHETMNDLIEICAEINSDDSEISLGASMIWPGTKWCGPGNIASDYDDLGVHSDTDKCCREHDHCPTWIGAYGRLENLVNPSRYTKMHCDCDDKFSQCLADSRDRIHNVIGFTFFDIYGSECFRKDYPQIGCSKYRGFGRFCVEYLHDYDQEPIYQWFDPKPYSRSARKNSSNLQLNQCLLLDTQRIVNLKPSLIDL